MPFIQVLGDLFTYRVAAGEMPQDIVNKQKKYSHFKAFRTATE
jgi:hypothetical protein